MDRASLVIIISFVGAAAVLVAGLWLLVRLDRSAARATTPRAPLAPPATPAPPAPIAPVLPLPVLMVVEDPPEEPEAVAPIAPIAPAAPVGPVADTSSRARVGVAAGVAAFVAILWLLIGTRRRRRPRD